MKYKSQKSLSFSTDLQKNTTSLPNFFIQATKQSLTKQSLTTKFLYHLILTQDTQILFKPFNIISSEAFTKKYPFMISDPINPINSESSFAFALERYFTNLQSSEQEAISMAIAIFNKIQLLEVQGRQLPQFYLNLQLMIKYFKNFQISQIADTLFTMLTLKSFQFIPNDLLLIEKKLGLYELLLSYKLANQVQYNSPSSNNQLVLFMQQQRKDHTYFIQELILKNQKRFKLLKIQQNFFSLMLSSHYFELTEKVQIIQLLTTKTQYFKKHYPLTHKIDLIFLLFTSNCETNALTLINQIKIHKVIQICKLNPKKYNYSIVKMLQSINLLDLKLEFASELHSTFSNQGIRLLIDSQIIFSISVNPIKCLLIYLELLDKLKERSSSLAPKIEDQKKKKKQAIRDIVNEISNLNVKRQIFQEVDSKGRSMYQLMSLQFDLLDTIEDIVSQRFKYGNGISLKRYKQASFMDSSIFKQITNDT